MKYILSLLLLLTFSYAEVYDPAKAEIKNFSPTAYEASMKHLYEKVSSDDEENLQLCRIYSERGKQYKSLKRNDIFYDITIQNCERRVKLYCGALMAAKQAESNTTK